jgi:hypothetical protein
VIRSTNTKDLADKIGYDADFVAAFEAGEERINMHHSKITY